MKIKRSLVLILLLVAVFVISACSDSARNDSEHNNSANNVAAESTLDQVNNADVSIPTDSGMADSVFDNAANPAKPENNTTSSVVEEDESTEESSKVETTESAVDATVPDVAPEEMTYAAFIALTPAEQRLYQESFKDLDAFFEWYTAAKEKYEKENPPIDIDGPIDLGKV